jgi:hypothetical protein
MERLVPEKIHEELSDFKLMKTVFHHTARLNSIQSGQN